jgi:hypothetical protein
MCTSCTQDMLCRNLSIFTMAYHMYICSSLTVLKDVSCLLHVLPAYFLFSFAVFLHSFSCRCFCIMVHMWQIVSILLLLNSFVIWFLYKKNESRVIKNWGTLKGEYVETKPPCAKAAIIHGLGLEMFPWSNAKKKLTKNPYELSMQLILYTASLISSITLRFDYRNCLYTFTSNTLIY